MFNYLAIIIMCFLSLVVILALREDLLPRAVVKQCEQKLPKATEVVRELGKTAKKQYKEKCPNGAGPVLQELGCTVVKQCNSAMAYCKGNPSASTGNNVEEEDEFADKLRAMKNDFKRAVKKMFNQAQEEATYQLGKENAVEKTLHRKEEFEKLLLLSKTLTCLMISYQGYKGMEMNGYSPEIVTKCTEVLKNKGAQLGVAASSVNTVLDRYTPDVGEPVDDTKRAAADKLFEDIKADCSTEYNDALEKAQDFPTEFFADILKKAAASPEAKKSN